MCGVEEDDESVTAQRRILSLPSFLFFFSFLGWEKEEEEEEEEAGSHRNKSLSRNQEKKSSFPPSLSTPLPI